VLLRVILGVTAVVYAAIGVAFIVAPDSLLPRVNITAPPGTALTDIRAVYGGLDFGIGAFLAFCYLRRQIALGLYASAFTLAGLACARTIGIILQPEQDPITYYLLAAEIIGVALAIMALVAGRQSKERMQ
jgi:hypothetical protein